MTPATKVTQMQNLNDKKWKTFFIGDLFLTLKNGLQVPTGAYVKKEDLLIGNTPRITVTSNNNGIYGLYHSTNKNYKVYENFISVSFLGDCFYHPYKASIDMKVHCLQLKNRKLNKYIALFLISSLQKMTKIFNYGDQLSSKDIIKKRISLPINEAGEPDYDFMEQYIRELEQQLIKQYLSYINMNNYMPPPILTKTISLNDKQWKIFIIGDLFAIEIGKSIDGNKVNRTSGHYPYITRKENNNGLDGFIDYDKNYLNVKFPVITIGNETAQPYVQDFPFYTGTKVNILSPKISLSKYTLQFIAQCLKMQKEKYSYAFTINSTRLKKQFIFLPINDRGEPDYDFMEQYMREREQNLIQQYLNYINDK